MTGPAIFFFILIWAILTGIIAVAKGRDFVAWFVLGLFFGIFATAYLVFAPRGDEPYRS